MVIVISVQMAWSWYWYMTSINCTKTLWDSPLYFKFINYAVKSVCMREFNVVFHKNIHNAMACLMDYLTYSWMCNTKQVGNGPIFSWCCQAPQSKSLAVQQTMTSATLCHSSLMLGLAYCKCTKMSLCTFENFPPNLAVWMFTALLFHQNQTYII